ncbi:hypothetical protein RND71_043539 [Anisodus tanguticus]|uniref:Uncharacterized protein n=1 Tax=Anisodus tanguticus TaxID=243964 RepID=A0AAE1QRK4_9SOLA|nr:hypothetical protein RND71_043539 [Anisodus tanguticus]
MGKRGRGVVDYYGLDPSDIDVYMGTFTKSFGAAGGYIAGKKNLIDFIRCNSHSALYATSISPPIAQQIISVIESIDSEDGADLKERLKMKEEDVDGFVAKLRSLAFKIHQFRKPTIAALDGVALGGGLEMALACDIRVCSSDCKLGLVETRLAIFPGAGGTQFLPRIIGPAKAKELIFSACILNGEEAEKIGLVNQTHLQNENKNAAYLNSINLAKKIIPNGPIALEAAKKSINTGLNYELEKSLEIERSFYQKIIPTKDRIEGLKSFIEKRKPIYKGE